MRYKTVCFVLSIVAWFPVATAPAQESEAEYSAIETVEFGEQVWPILQSRCFRCHGQSESLGDLRLDDYQSVLRGGHSGNPILGSVEDSELLRRIKSSEEGYRMPKDEVPLSEREVALIESWIAQGGSWDPPSGVAEVLSNEFTQDSLNRRFDVWYANYRKLRFLAIPVLVFLFGILLVERRKRSLADSTVTSNRRGLFNRLAQHARPSHYLVGWLAFLLTAVSVLYYHEWKERRKIAGEFEALQNPFLVRSQPNGKKAIPKPIDPHHPPRLGGLYYRGNDERSERLYNGGFYRTATMQLALRDANGRDLQWGDRVPDGSLDVFVRIERSPFATQSLFRDDALTNCSLTRQLPGSDSPALQDTPSPFQIIEPGEVWQSSYTIATIGSSQAIEPIAGRLYLTSGGGSQLHYGIEYRIRLTGDNEIEASSELWMGAILVTSKVLVPEGTQMSVQEWFDFRPIPEIVGGNTDDPELLGISKED